MYRLVTYASITLAVFLFITPVFLFYSSLSNELIGEISFSVFAMVELIALVTMAVGWMVYELTRQPQYVCIVIVMGLLLFGDFLGLPRLLDGNRILGSEQALGSFTGLLILVARFAAASVAIMSWYYANNEEKIVLHDRVTAAAITLLVVGIGTMVLLTQMLPEFRFGLGQAVGDISTLILIPTLLMFVVAAAGYMVRFCLRFEWVEALICFSLMIGSFNHLALFIFGTDAVARFIMPSRMLSYSLVLAFMLFSLRRHYQKSYLASSAKGEFLATMSHEIRTPLNGVLGLAQLLHESKLDTEQKEQVNGILSSGRTLMALLNDILDMSKIEAARVELERRPFYPADTTYDLQKFVTSIAEQKNLSVVCNDSVLRDVMFTGDEVRLRQILWNLMSNAVKFTNKGGVRLEVQKWDDSQPPPEGVRTLNEDEVLFHFAVIDTGVGISADRLKAIFAPFTQADNSTMRQYGGTGLGLSIAFSLTALMGGRMTVSSIERQGTRFDVWLPFKTELAETSRDARIDEGTNAGDTVLAGARILVVEDNEINAKVIAGMLKRHGLVVDIVTNGRDAVHAFREQRYDLVLMDAHMPVLDGEGATRHIRELERFQGGSRIPIVCVTADAFGDRHRDFLAAGMDEVLTKPVEERTLYSALLRFLRNRPRVASPPGKDENGMAGAADRNEKPDEGTILNQKETTQAETENEGGQAALVGMASVEGQSDHTDTPQPAAMAEGDRNGDGRELVDTRRFDELCEILGKERLLDLIDMLPVSYQDERTRMIEALNTSDRNVLRTAAHTVKGMASNLAAAELARACRNLELYDGDFDKDLETRITALDKLTEDTVAAMKSVLA